MEIEWGGENDSTIKTSHTCVAMDQHSADASDQQLIVHGFVMMQMSLKLTNTLVIKYFNIQKTALVNVNHNHEKCRH